MFKDIINAIRNAIRKLFSNPSTTILAIVLFALFAAVVWAYFATGVATVTEVILTLVVLPLIGALLFFAVQALGLSYVRVGVGPGYLLRRALADSWKLLVASLPLMLLWWLCAWGFNQIETHHLSYEADKRWLRTALDWLRFFVLWFALPLMAMHVWLATVRTGLPETFRKYLRHCAQALAPRSFVLALLLFAVSGLLVWLLLYTKTQFGGLKVETILFGLRFTLALLVGFLGWFATLGALAEITVPRWENEVNE